MDPFWLLRFGLLVLGLQGYLAAPAMNAIRDGGRLSDGTCILLRVCPAVFGGGEANMGVGGRVYGPGENEQNTSTPEEIVAQAYLFLSKNLITGTHEEYGFPYSFSMPSAYKYGPSQWLWGTSLFNRG